MDELRSHDFDPGADSPAGASVAHTMLRMARLHAVTAALCEAALPIEVARVVGVEMRAIVGADVARIAVPSDDGSALLLLDYAAPEAPQAGSRRVPIGGDEPLARAFRESSPLWIAARAEPPGALEGAAGPMVSTVCLPLCVHGARLGALEFGFGAPRRFDAAERALLDDLARCAGLALERARIYESERRARREADAAKASAELLFRLAEATAGTTDLAALQELALDGVIRLLRVDRAAILLADVDGVMRFASSRGLSETYQRAVEGHSPWGPDDTDPRPLLIPDVAREPSLAAFLPLFAAEGVAAIGFVPLVHQRRLLGKLMVYADAPRVFSRHDEELAVTVAAHIGGAVERARLRTAEREARDRNALLLEASGALASTLDLDRALEQLAWIAAPRIADWCVVALERGAVGEAAPPILYHRDPAVLAQTTAMWRPDAVGVGCWASAARVGRTGVAAWIERTTDAELAEVARDAEHLEALRALGIGSQLAVPMTVRGTTLGVLVLATSATGRRLGRAELELADLLAQRAAVAVDNALLYEAEARARAEAERLAAEAQAAIRAREEVLAVVSHDLRNPLNAIVISTSSLLRLDSLDAPDPRRGARIRKSAEVIRRSAERMTRLLGDLIDFASVQAGRLSITRAPTTAREIVGAVAELFASIAHERELRLRTELPPSPLALECDCDRAIQALSNLVANAVKVTASGGEVVLSAAHGAGEVVFSVADTGPGISAEELPRIFDRYWRGRSAGYRGTGLGLAIARGIVEAHGGRIWAESTPGVGSRFFFALPA